MSGNRKASAPAASNPKRSAQRPRTRKQKVLRVVKWLAILGFASLALGVVGFAVLYRMINLPDPNKDFQTQTSFVYYAGGKDQVGSFATQNRESIPLDEMPQNLQDAVVSAENRTFWTDHGIDVKSILRAAFSNAAGNPTQGASTITQQYIKVLYLGDERTYTRKLKEAILSLKIQREMSKSEILQGYLNTIYFGRGAYGVQAAAQAYFDTNAKDLNLRQCAVLGSVLNDPSGMDPANGKSAKQALKGRYDYVLNGMASAGNITDAQAQKAEKRLPKFPKVKAQSKYGGQRGFMLQMVRDQLHQLGFSDEQIDGGGLRVTTTFTRKAMAAAKQGVLQVRPPGISDKQLHAAVASVEPGTGAVRGFYAGQDYLQSQINWAETGGMVGSTFKPFAVAAALKDGFSLKDTFDGNSPYYYNGQGTGLHVVNEGTGSDGLGTDYGPHVSLLKATEQSINTAFADLTMSMPDGPKKILSTAESLGIPPWDQSVSGLNHLDTSPGLRPEAGIALGSATIAPINMANAYASIADGGQRVDPHVIDKVTSAKGKVLYQYKQHADQAVSSDIAADTSYAMQQVVQHGTGTAALALGRPAAGKTGTATNSAGDVASSWFVGYTPQLATAVMYVRGSGTEALNGWLPDYNGQAGYFGANYPTRTWTAVMAKDMEGVPVEQFPPPANLKGNPPVPGHEPWTPPPSPTRTPSNSPSKTPSATPSETPSATPSSTASASPSAPPSPSDSCGLLGCGSPSGSSSPSDTPSTPPPGNGGGPGPKGRRRSGRRRPGARSR